MKESREQARKEEEARVKAEREQIRLKRERDELRAAEADRQRQDKQAEIDRAVREGIAAKLRHDAETAQAAKKARADAEWNAEEVRRQRLERDEDLQWKKREQDSRHRAEKDDFRLRPEDALPNDFRLRPEDALPHRSRDSSWESTAGQRGSYVDPREATTSQRGPHVDTVEKHPIVGMTMGMPVQVRGQAVVQGDRSVNYSARVSSDENIHDAEDDRYSRNGQPSRSRPYGGNVKHTPEVKKDIWGNIITRDV